MLLFFKDLKSCAEYEHASYFDDSQPLLVDGTYLTCKFSKLPGKEHFIESIFELLPSLQIRITCD